jgi:hypothetical protein
MAAVGGPIESITIGGRNFAVAQDADTNRKLGGSESEVQMNGDGTGRKILNRVPFMITGLTVNVDDDLGDQEFLQDVADNTGFEDIDITFANGETYSGQGTVSGELAFMNNSSLASLELSGPGRLTKQ